MHACLDYMAGGSLLGADGVYLSLRAQSRPDRGPGAEGLRLGHPQGVRHRPGEGQQGGRVRGGRTAGLSLGLRQVQNHAHMICSVRYMIVLCV